MIALSTLFFLLLPADGSSGTETESSARSYRMIDLDGDGKLDRLEVDAEGTLSISLNRGARQFAPVVQELPRVAVHDVLSDDLDGDGHTDLYLVSRGPNAVLLGDGSGLFVEDDGALGLADAGAGLRAERLDVDGDGIADVLLHNAGGDVVFWGTEGNAFERDAFAPVSSVTPAVTPPVTALPVAGTPDSGSSAAGNATFEVAGSGRGDASGSSRVPVSVPGTPAPGAPGAGVPGGMLPAGGGMVSPTVEEVVQIPFPPCAPGVADATSGMCLTADSVPAFGTLYPLGMEFNILPTGEVGMGTTAPEADLHVAGSLTSELRISANTTTLNQGGADIFLSEGLGIDCGWRLAYDGITDNALSFISDCGSPQTRMALHRELGTVLIGGDDFAASITGPGLVRVNGDVSQSLGGDGLIKAGVHVDGSLGASTRFFNNLPGGSSVSVSRLGTGLYEIDFNANVSGRFYIGTIGGGSPTNAPDATIEVSPRSGNANAVFVETDDEAGVSIDTDFFVAIF